MAVFAALASLTNLMEDMQNHPQLSSSLAKIQIQYLEPMLFYLLYFIETYGSRRRAKDLERQIASAAQNVEDVIESHIVDWILDGQASSGFLFNESHIVDRILDVQPSSCTVFNVHLKMENMKKKFTEKKQSEDDDNSRLDTVIKEMESIVVKVREVEASLGELSYEYAEYRAFKKSTTLVGFNQEIPFLLNRLTSDTSSLQIISVIGMGGIGKTTLARFAFEHSLIVHHFDVCVWVNVSVKYSMRKVYHQLLSGGVEPHESDIELAERLHKKLYGRRYLVVLDDVWDCHILNEMRLCLPDNGNGSRVVITTRIKQQEFSDSWTSFVKLLDDESSWKLFCERAFGGDYCPGKLEDMGKWIVEQCKGLPLSIVVIGGHLRNSPMTRHYWAYVSDNVSSILSSGEDERCLNILSLSYNHLPAHLKPCFLYTGVFPEDGEILVSKLIQLWVAEGFIKKPNDAHERLEEIAEGYLEDLVDRNLIIVGRRGQYGNIVACKIHDLLRDLCITMAERENFLRVWRLRQSPSLLGGERRVAIHGGTMDHVDHRELFDALKSAPLVRSLIFDAGVDDLPSDLKLLKILSVIEEGTDVRRLQLLQSGSKFLQQYVNLRYLHDGLLPHNHSLGRILELPSLISRLWNLQTLILGGNFHAPPQIWEMASLRHLICNRIFLPDPPSKGAILQNLQTLSEAEDFRLSEEVCARILNVKNLRMFNGYLNEPKSLTKLESLTCEFSSEEPVTSDSPQLLEFPSSLVELCLIKCCIGWEDLSAIGSLPGLQILKLGYSIKGNEWNPIKGEFKQLKHLEIWGWDDLIEWNAEWSHFPVLKSLTLKGLTELSEIPSDIGYIPTLESIKLEECSVSAAISAVRIVEEQRSCGNEDLQLQVCFQNQENSRMFMEMVEEEGPFEHQSSSSRNDTVDQAVFKFKC